MSGRRTWMPEEPTETTETTKITGSATVKADRVHENPTSDSSVSVYQAGGTESETARARQTDPNAQESTNGADNQDEPREAPGAESAGVAGVSGEDSTRRPNREWVPGGAGRGSADTPANTQSATSTRDSADTQDEDTSVMDEPEISRAASAHGARVQATENAQAPNSTASDADTTDIPVASREQREDESAFEEPAAEEPAAEEPAAEKPAADTNGSTARAGVWSSVRNRISGKGPLSAERDAQAEQETTSKQEPAIEPGGSMDPNERMNRLSSSIQNGDHEPATAVQEDEDDREGLAGSGPLLWFIDHWIPITVPLVLLCVGIFVFATIFTGGGQSGEEIASSKGGSGGGKGEPAEKAGGGAKSIPLYESGLTFDYSQKDGKATLNAGDLTWEGEVTEGGEDSPKETVTLAGPTAAKINRGYEMDGGSDEPGKVETMTYAVEAEDAPDIHATYQRFSGHTSNGPVDAPNGSYSVTADSGDLIAEGNYSDRRTGEGEDGNEVIRTYTETVPGKGEPEQFRVRYEAPEGTPIPALVGWQEPDVRNGEGEGSS